MNIADHINYIISCVNTLNMKNNNINENYMENENISEYNKESDE